MVWPFQEAQGEEGLACRADSQCPVDQACLINQCQLPPLYLFLFTHTEDHINHTLSEERFQRLLPTVTDLSRDYPDLTPSWTLAFMGADAETLAERHPETGLLKVLQGEDASQGGVLHFGYHGAHEPTYTNNALTSLEGDQADWERTVQGALAYLTLGKDPLLGGVDPSRTGGVKKVEEVWGEIQVVSGLALDQALVFTLDRLLGDFVMFGFPDHGPLSNPDYGAALKRLISRLTPEHRTPAGLFWMNGHLRINDGNPLDGVGALNLIESSETLAGELALLDPARLQVINAHLASKYLYAKESPTDYAYDHPEAPELTEADLWSEEAREGRYQTTAANLKYLAAEMLSGMDGSRFVSPRDLVDLFVDESGEEIPLERVERVARALLQTVDGALPDFVVARGYYYSLAECWSLLVQALATYDKLGELPDGVLLKPVYGPLASTPAISQSRLVAMSDLLQAAQGESLKLEAGSGFPMPQNIIPAQVTLPGGNINAAEYLQAVARVLVRISEWSPESESGLGGMVRVAPLAGVAGIHELLVAVQEPRYPGTSWTLKPARHR
ncbi:MAG: hypothetical protein HQL52_01610 [Magnetococcales bacterium]|nr:hypothetical protein [Magnetococcales bacterium]